MKVISKAIGEVDVAEDSVFHVPAGMIGFPDARHYALIPFPDKEVPFFWWQSMDGPSPCFVVFDPALVFSDYRVDVPASDLEEIELASAEQATVLVVVTIPENPREMTANLMGPLVVNQSARKAKQLVLLDSRYTTKHRLIPAEASDHACAHSETE